MSEELLQRNLKKNPGKIGTWDFYNIGSTTINQLKKAGVIKKHDYGDIGNKKVDGIIVEQKEIIAIVEYKDTKEFNTQKKKNNAILQVIEVAKKIGVKLIIATDTQETLWVNVETGNRVKKNGNELKNAFDPQNPNLQIFIREVLESISENNDEILPKKLIDPTGLAKQIWQDVWSVSGATPENCLYTFVELFIFKYLSDLGILEEGVNFNHLWDRYSYKIEKPEEKALEYYANTIRPKIKELFPENKDDKTTIINGTIFVSKDQKAVSGYSTVFKKVIERFREYGELKNIDLDFKSKLFESFLKQSISKKNWGQYFTPIKVVRAINKMVGDLKEDLKICDPACGVGKFPLELVKNKLRDFFQINKGKIIPKIWIKGFDRGFDKEEQKTIILAKANMLIYFSDLIKENPQLTKEFSILFNNAFILKTNSILGTLAEPVEDEYDLILTNPPYAVSGSSNLKLEIDKDSELGKYYKISGLGVESLFIEWIVKALKPGGKGFIVVPDGILNRQEKKIRQFILDNCYIEAIISLPKNTFFTTPKKTYILAITKKNDVSKKQTNPVFTYLVSEIGESRDIYRFDIKQDDLTEAVELFSSFKGNWRKFQELNNDKKCKLQAIENFKSEKNWAIDRWWTKTEQTELGIVKEENIVSLNTFGEIIDEILDKLRKHNNLIKEISKKKKNKPSNFKEISLKNEKYFNLFIGKRVLKKEIINLNGMIPIYSANVKVPIGNHEKSIISDFNNNFVLWGIDGDFEFNFILKNQPFYPTDHCGVIRILNDDIFPEYLMFQLETAKHKFGFDRGLRASLENMKQISISVPFESESKIDINKQKEVIEKYKKIKEIKTKIKNYEQKVDSLSIELSDLFDSQNNRDVTIDKIFDLTIRTNDSKFTKIFINKHEGDILVYGASKDKDAIIGKVKNNLNGIKYFENCLTLNIIGSTGKVFYRKGRFSLTGNAIPLIIKSIYKDWLDENYLKYTLESELRIQNFGIVYESVGKNKIRNIKIKIPTTSLGEFDIVKQREIADKYHKIEEIKKNVKTELKKMENIKVDIDI